MQRPTQNGSSGTTFELLVSLTALGGSLLTVLALTVRRPEKKKEDYDDE